MRTEKHVLNDLLVACSRQYAVVREHTVALADPLSEEDCCAQSMPDASPIKWHMAHTTWFFETFILERFEPDFKPYHAAFRMLFNSYYNGVGEKHPRPQRGLLTRPSLTEIRLYRKNVDARMLQLLSEGPAIEKAHLIVALVELGLQHEQQHQELMLTDIKHLLSLNPLQPAYSLAVVDVAASGATADWFWFEAGVTEIGYAGTGFCFDNERPRHRQFVERFAMASHLVTNAEFLAFIKAGGYRNPALWLSEGWDWVQAQQLTQPLYWHCVEQTGSQDWNMFGLQGMQSLNLQQPACHLSFFEADAYARWAGARLPTEAEWEHAATLDKTDCRLSQLFNAAWQWTASSYAPYPGYAIAEGAIGEYNGKFMVNQYVLKGSSCATPSGHARSSYRNFFPATARWQFSGIRLAKSP